MSAAGFSGLQIGTAVAAVVLVVVVLKFLFKMVDQVWVAGFGIFVQALLLLPLYVIVGHLLLVGLIAALMAPFGIAAKWPALGHTANVCLQWYVVPVLGHDATKARLDELERHPVAAVVGALCFPLCAFWILVTPWSVKQHTAFGSHGAVLVFVAGVVLGAALLVLNAVAPSAAAAWRAWALSFVPQQLSWLTRSSAPTAPPRDH